MARRCRRPKSSPSAASCSARRASTRTRCSLPSGSRSLGIELRSKTVVGDSRREVAEHLRRALDRADLVILTGGLGPTDDDVTRDALADVLGPAAHRASRHRRAPRAAVCAPGLQMPDVNRRQALVSRAASSSTTRMAPRRDRWSTSAIGSWSSCRARRASCSRCSMRSCRGPLAARVGPERLFRTTLFTVGRGESHVEELVAADLLALAAGDAADRDDHPRRARADRAASRAAIGGRRRRPAARSRRPATRSSARSGPTSSAPTGARWKRSSGSSCSTGSSRSRPPSRARAGCCCRG